MQEETTRETVHITEIEAWEFRADGSFAPKTLPVDLRLSVVEPREPRTKRSLFVHALCISKREFEGFVSLHGWGDSATEIFRNPISGAFAAIVQGTELFYFENILGLLEFFRRYGEFFRAVSQSEIASRLSTISSALQEKKSNS